MRLGCEKPRVVRNLDHFHYPSVRRGAAQLHAFFRQCKPEIIVDFIAVTVAFHDFACAVDPECPGGRVEHARVGAKPQGAADIFHTALIRHQCDHRVCRVRIQLDAVCIVIAADIAGKFDNGNLHSKAEAEIGNLIFPRIFCGENFALHTAGAESAGDKNAGDVMQQPVCIFFCQFLGIHPLDVYGGPPRDAAML